MKYTWKLLGELLRKLFKEGRVPFIALIFYSFILAEMWPWHLEDILSP